MFASRDQAPCLVRPAAPGMLGCYADLLRSSGAALSVACCFHRGTRTPLAAQQARARGAGPHQPNAGLAPLSLGLSLLALLLQGWPGPARPGVFARAERCRQSRRPANLPDASSISIQGQA